MTMESSKTAVPAENSEPHNGTACWSCGDMRAAQFCSACGQVQPPLPVDYFAFFGLPRKLDLDVSGLENDFYELSRKLHPDLYVLSASRRSSNGAWSKARG